MWSRSDDRRPCGPIKVDIPSPPDDYQEDSEDVDGYGYAQQSPYQRSRPQRMMHSPRRRDARNFESPSFGGESSCSSGGMVSSSESSLIAAENGDYYDFVDCRECVDADVHHQHHQHHPSDHRSSRSVGHQKPIDGRCVAPLPPMQQLPREVPGPSTSKPKTSQVPEDVEPLQPLQKPKVEEELCTICGDRASGYHYNALSCEGCKGFFRRSVTRGASYVCKYGGNCEMDMWMRRKCQACRLKQCRNVGMKEECLLSERQCIARNARRQTRQKIFKPRVPRHRLGTISVKSQLMSTMVMSAAGPPTPATNCSDDRSSPACHSPLDRLSDEHRELVSRIVACQDKYELPTPEDVARITALNIASTFAKANASDAIFGHMVEMTILVTRLVVEFAKHLPGFQSLCKEDQIVLLKGSASEVMMLRTSRRFDPETNTVVFGDGQPFSQHCMAFGGLQGFVDSMFEFSRGMASMAVDNAEYALLTALCIFSDRPGVRDSHVIDSIQEVYAEVLLAYVGHRRLYGSHFLAKLLMKLVELRTLSANHSECLYRLTIEKGSLPPLLSEYFDIPEAPGS